MERPAPPRLSTNNQWGKGQAVGGACSRAWGACGYKPHLQHVQGNPGLIRANKKNRLINSGMPLQRNHCCPNVSRFAKIGCCGHQQVDPGSGIGGHCV